MNVKSRGILVSLLIFALGPAHAAGSCNGCTIKSLGAGPYYDGICTSNACIFIDIAQTVTGKPGCSSNSAWDFVLDVNTASGRATYALLVAAMSAGKPVNIAGSNQCSLSASGLVENLYYVIQVE
jgi:hypothetical protein